MKAPMRNLKRLPPKPASSIYVYEIALPIAVLPATFTYRNVWDGSGWVVNGRAERPERSVGAPDEAWLEVIHDGAPGDIRFANDLSGTEMAFDSITDGAGASNTIHLRIGHPYSPLPVGNPALLKNYGPVAVTVVVRAHFKPWSD